MSSFEGSAADAAASLEHPSRRRATSSILAPVGRAPPKTSSRVVLSHTNVYAGEDMSAGSYGGDSWASLLDAMKQVRTAWPSRGWSWDGRLSCVSSSFAVELEPKARAAAGLALSQEWGPSTLHRAPQPLREHCERVGGLRAGQLIFMSPAIGSAFTYGLWWPWGDGMTTSMRIGLCPDARQEVFQRLRDVFGVEL